MNTDKAIAWDACVMLLPMSEQLRNAFALVDSLPPAESQIADSDWSSLVRLIHTSMADVALVQFFESLK